MTERNEKAMAAAEANAPCVWCGRPEEEHAEPTVMVAAENQMGRMCPVPGVTSQYYTAGFNREDSAVKLAKKLNNTYHIVCDGSRVPDSTLASFIRAARSPAASPNDCPTQNPEGLTPPTSTKKCPKCGWHENYCICFPSDPNDSPASPPASDSQLSGPLGIADNDGVVNPPPASEAQNSPASQSSNAEKDGAQ